MTIEDSVRETIALYAKHGWNLRRVLLSHEHHAKLGQATDQLFPGAEVIGSDIDAAWFSRPSRSGSTAWELRRLIGSPFALVEVIDDGTEAAELESILKQTEERLREHDRKAASDVLSPSSTMSH